MSETGRKSSIVSVEELVKIMEANTLQDDPRETRTERSSKLVKAYLIKNEPEFVRVMEFRDRVSYQSRLLQNHQADMTRDGLKIRSKGMLSSKRSAKRRIIRMWPASRDSLL